MAPGIVFKRNYVGALGEPDRDETHGRFRMLSPSANDTIRRDIISRSAHVGDGRYLFQDFDKTIAVVQPPIEDPKSRRVSENQTSSEYSVSVYVESASGDGKLPNELTRLLGVKGFKRK